MDLDYCVVNSVVCKGKQFVDSTYGNLMDEEFADGIVHMLDNIRKGIKYL